MKAKRTKSVNVIWTVLFAKYLFLEEICNYIEAIWWNIPRDRYLFCTIFWRFAANRLSCFHRRISGRRFVTFSLGRGGGRLGTPLYKPYRYVPPRRVGFLRLFGLKTGIDFAPFWYGIGYGFRGNYRSVPNEYKVRKRNMLIRNGF